MAKIKKWRGPDVITDRLDVLLAQIVDQDERLLVWLPNGHPVFGTVRMWDERTIWLETLKGPKVVTRAQIACAEVFKEKMPDDQT